MRINGLLVERFSAPRPAGRVIGSQDRDAGWIRDGCDDEGIMSIDHHALRIAPMRRPGWRRHLLRYGPFRRVNGQTVVISMLNGHHGSQTSKEWASPRKRFLRAVIRSALQPLPSPLVPRRWADLLHPPHSHLYNWPHLDRNMTAGWFSRPGPPARRGNSFLVQAAGIDNGTLLCLRNRSYAVSLTALANIPLTLMVIARNRGAVYYASSAALSPSPHDLRPLAIDTHDRTSTLYAGVHQCILGEVAFAADSRVYGVRAGLCEHWRNWYGPAHCADSLRGSGDIRNRQLHTGQRWRTANGFTLTSRGAVAAPAGSMALTFPRSRTGLIHLRLRGPLPGAGLVWRARDRRNYWTVRLDRGCAVMLRVDDGVAAELCRARLHPRSFRFAAELTVVDTGASVKVMLDGRSMLSVKLQGQQCCGNGVGIEAAEACRATFHHFEAHPACLTLPHDLRCAGPLPAQPDTREALRDDFQPASGDLGGRLTGSGLQWRRELGAGRFALDSAGGARVVASCQSPNPGRTAYALPWSDGGFAELHARIMPPGVRRGEGHRGRAGLLFYQDPDNYLIVSTYLDDWRVGRSISAFFRLGGVEELHRAVWTNVGFRLHWGRIYELGVTFDGMRFLARLDGEPVLYRALTDIEPKATRLTVNRVGIVANWEFGDDTGSRFLYFAARARTISRQGIPSCQPSIDVCRTS